MEYKQVFGEKIKKLRKSQKLTQEQLAELIEAESGDTVSRYEKGENFPFPERLKKLVIALGTSYNELLDDEKELNLEKQNLIDKIKSMLSCFSEKDLNIISAQIKTYRDSLNKINRKN